MIRTKNEDYIVKENSNTRYFKLKLIAPDLDENGIIIYVSKLQNTYDKETMSLIQDLCAGDYVEAELEKENNAWKVHKISKIYT